MLKNLDGLETNRINQLVVLPTLQTTRDENIFVDRRLRGLCPWNGKEGQNVPPRAQAAHQQAHAHLQADQATIWRVRSSMPWHYRDFGSLVSLGEYSTVGSLMGGLMGRSLWIEGLFARLMYRSLYKMHEYALHGPTKVTLDTIGPPDHATYRAARETALRRAMNNPVPLEYVTSFSQTSQAMMQHLATGAANERRQRANFTRYANWHWSSRATCSRWARCGWVR